MIIQGKLTKCSCGGNAFQRKIGARYEVYCHSCENTTGLQSTMAVATRLWNTQVAYEARDSFWGSEMTDSDWAGKDFGDQ